MTSLPHLMPMLRTLSRRITRSLPLAASLGLGLLLTACSNAQSPGYYGSQVPMASPGVVRAHPVSGPAYQTTSYLAADDTSGATYQPAVYHPDDGFGADIVLAATQGPNIRASSWLLIDAHTGKHLASRNAETPRAVASTQKLITALVVLDAGNLDKKVRVQSTDCQVEPTCLGLKNGEVYTRRELLYAFLVKSCNDVANVLARDNAGSISAFAAKMNAKARSLGCTSSNFKNPHGLTVSGQYSTARDMARVAMAAYRNGVIRDAVRRRSYTFHRANGSTAVLKSTNDLLGRMPECNGMKTGYTVASGRCLVSTASRGGRDVILVQLGTRTKYIWDDGKLLMTWGLQKAGRGGSVAMR